MLQFYLSCVYSDLVKVQRHLVLDRLAIIGEIFKDAWLAVGYFNELMDNTEKVKGPRLLM